MDLVVKNKETQAFMDDFVTITDSRMALFDRHFNEILGAGEMSAVCTRVRSTPEGVRRCNACDALHQQELSDTGVESLVFTCHCGMLDGIAPIVGIDGEIMGYLMIGQCVPADMDIEHAWQNTVSLTSSYVDISDLKEDFMRHRRCSGEYLTAFMRLVNACAVYVRQMKYISRDSNQQFARIKDYISGNLRGDLSADAIGKALFLSRNKLYAMVKQSTGMSLGNYVLSARLEYAKELLRQDLPYTISDIADLCGISDFNYFSRVFKKNFGVSPRMYKKSAQESK